MQDTFTIKLKRLRFYSKIGVFEQERRVGNEFEVNVEVRISADGFAPENLGSSISYAEIYDEVKKVMREETLLMETSCVAIRDSLTNRWPQIINGKIEITKLMPPIAGIDGECGVDFFFEKNDK